MEAMLATPIQPADIDEILNDPRWIAEAKMDGRRLLIECHTTGKAVGRNRRGERTNTPQVLLDAFSTVANDIVFDGELVGHTFHVFDLPSAGDQITTSSPWALRRRTLGRLIDAWGPDPELVRLVPFGRTLDQKVALIEEQQATGGEGCVFKRFDSTYEPGRRSKDWRKLKLVSHVDCFVTAMGDTKKNMSLVLFDTDGNEVPVGECTRLAGDGHMVRAGDVVTVKVLGVSKAGRLIQPTSPRLRRGEVSREDCSIEQLSTLRSA